MKVQLIAMHTIRVHRSDKCNHTHQSDWSIFCIGGGTTMLYLSIALDIWVLLLKPCHVKYHIVVYNNSNNKIDCMAQPCSSDIVPTCYLAYNWGVTQRLTISCGDRR
jgi:hypothetical protein